MVLLLGFANATGGEDPSSGLDSGTTSEVCRVDVRQDARNPAALRKAMGAMNRIFVGRRDPLFSLAVYAMTGGGTVAYKLLVAK